MIDPKNKYFLSFYLGLTYITTDSEWKAWRTDEMMRWVMVQVGIFLKKLETNGRETFEYEFISLEKLKSIIWKKVLVEW